MQTKTTLAEQIDELKSVIAQEGRLPIVLIGHSWGAWLCYLTAAYHPALVSKLILIGSGAYQAKYVEQMVTVRLSRYTAEERAEYEAILAQLTDAAAEGQPEAYHRLGALVAKAETFHPLPPTITPEDAIDTEGRSYHPLLAEVQHMRSDGSLLELAQRITCPVVAIHGDYDTRPIRGVAEPLAATIADFRMIVLQRCGHTPWVEQYARDDFFRILTDEVGHLSHITASLRE